MLIDSPHSAFTAPTYQSSSNTSTSYIPPNSYPLLSHSYYSGSCSSSLQPSSLSSTNPSTNVTNFMPPSILYPPLYSTNQSLQHLLSNRSNNFDNGLSDNFYIFNNNNNNNSCEQNITQRNNSNNYEMTNGTNNSETIPVWRPY